MILKEKADKYPPATGIRSMLTMGLISFWIFQAARNIGDQIIQTFVPTYIHDVMGLTIAGASFIYGVGSLTGVAAAPYRRLSRR